MKEIILESFCNSSLPEIGIPEEYKFIDISTFGEKDGNIVKMYDYQENALKNVMNALNFYYNDKNSFYVKYQMNGLNADLLEKVDFNKTEDNEAFRIMSNHYKIENDKIPFKELINRASFWMATGSGKTLVMIKLIEILFRLSKLDKNSGSIDKNDILILAPKQQILDQIKEHIDVFNRSSDLFIDLRSLKHWEKTKKEQLDLYEESKLTVFYYTSHNLKADGISTENELNYETFLHGTDINGYKFGKWYVILDEAHKGVTGDSKRQSIYQILAKEGFLFNFSATFTDAIDKATTVSNFNLERFINSGYGKHLKVTDQQFKNFNKRKDDENSADEKRIIVLKSLITLTAIKKAKGKIDAIKNNLYHNPLMLTIANTIQTEEADLKVFFKELAAIAQDNCDITESKNALLKEFNNKESKNFEFGSGSVSDQFFKIISEVTLSDIKKYVFNTNGSGVIEIIEIDGNQKELAFKMSTANSKPFALLVASDATNWMKDFDGFTVSKDIVSESYFKKLNENENSINILLGKQIFAEGWDSNRPNVINFINIGVGDAQKFVLQAIGRGIRIEPIKGIRKRLDKAPDKEKYLTVAQNNNIEKFNQGIETVFIFSTNKEAVGAILKNIEQNEIKDDWQLVDSIEKTVIANDLFVPEYEELSITNPNKFNITKNDFKRVENYSNSLTEKLLVVDNGLSIQTINKVKSAAKNDLFFNFAGNTREYSPNKILLEIENHFNSKPNKLKKFRKIIDTDITHFQKVRVKELQQTELQELRNEILSKIGEYSNPLAEMERISKIKESDPVQYKIEFEKLFKKETGITNPKLPKIDKTFIKEHYYNPVLLADEINKDYFQNIIKEPSEVTFFNDLIKFFKSKDNSLKKNYDWWYFSKLVENVDSIHIPYFNQEKGVFSKFFPDFIFWLKKDGKYFIKFVDPKGVTLAPQNTIDKLTGFENIFDVKTGSESDDFNVSIFLYNPNKKSLLKNFEKYSVTEIVEIF